MFSLSISSSSSIYYVSIDLNPIDILPFNFIANVIVYWGLILEKYSVF